MQNANEYQKHGRHAMIASQNDFRDEHETFILYTQNIRRTFIIFPNPRTAKEVVDRTQLYCEKVLGDVTIRGLFESRFFAKPKAENPLQFRPK